jgi:hypothetical protein
VLLFCLTLPGLVFMSLLLLSSIIEWRGIGSLLLVTILLFLQPGMLILLLIGAGQSTLLRKPGGHFTFGGLVRLFLISIAYVYGLWLSGHSASLES